MAKRYLGGGISFEQKDVYQEFSEEDTPSPGGSSTLSGLTDVDISNPSNGQTLVYDAASQKWVNGTPSGGATILQATFELSEMGEVVTLAQTAAELFALCSAGLVFIAYTVPAGTYDPDDPAVNRYMPVLNFAISTQGDTTAYLFAIADVMSGNQPQTDPLAPTDTVVFMSPR